MHWILSNKSSPRARALADRHYNRQSIGSPWIAPPGRCVVLLTSQADAVWVTVQQRYAFHRWPGAWVCTLFRNESPVLSSLLIREAVAATLALWGEPPLHGFVTFVNPVKVRRKRDPGRCFRRAGFVPCGETSRRHHLAFQLLPAHMPRPVSPLPHA